MKKSKGLRGSVNQHCKDCIYDPESKGGWKQQVAACSVRTCALFDVRPQPKPRANDQIEAMNIPVEAEAA